MCVMGHVDHGKTSLLDRIRGTSLAEVEAGAITQHIGATEIPLSYIKEICGPLMGSEFKIPGLLFIDTPGHHAFTTLRSRGGALADIAVVVVDVNEGFLPQTIEALKILRQFKTPFVLAANKIDLIHGWYPHENESFRDTYKRQSERATQALDGAIYQLIEQLHKEGFSSDRYDRIRDFRTNIGVIPISAKTGEGVPDILMLLIGLAQRFLESNLQIQRQGAGVGTVLEVKEEKGLGTTLDAILYDGELKMGDKIIIGSKEGPIVTKVRALLKPRPLSEIRSEERFRRVTNVTAASGIKITAHGLEKALSGSPLYVVKDEKNISHIMNEIQSELDRVTIQTDEVGVILKADTIGSLEAMINELRNNKIPIYKAKIGNISKRDIIEAATINDPSLAVVIGFCVSMLPDAKEEALKTKVRVFQNNVIYQLIKDYNDWVKHEQSMYEKERMEMIIKPGRFRLLPDYVFRQSKPAVVGVKVIGGVVKPGVGVIRENGIRVGTIKGIQEHGKSSEYVDIGKEAAFSIDGPTVGRQINEGDMLYVDIPGKHAKILERELCNTLSEDEAETLRAFLDIKRKKDPLWAK